MQLRNRVWDALRRVRYLGREVNLLSRLSDAFRSHHRQLRERLDRLASEVARDPQRADLDGLVRFLRQELLPHPVRRSNTCTPQWPPCYGCTRIPLRPCGSTTRISRTTSGASRLRWQTLDAVASPGPTSCVGRRWVF